MRDIDQYEVVHMKSCGYLAFSKKKKVSGMIVSFRFDLIQAC